MRDLRLLGKQRRHNEWRKKQREEKRIELQITQEPIKLKTKRQRSKLQIDIQRANRAADDEIPDRKSVV